MTDCEYCGSRDREGRTCDRCGAPLPGSGDDGPIVVNADTGMVDWWLTQMMRYAALDPSRMPTWRREGRLRDLV